MNDIKNDRRPDGEPERAILPAQLDHVVDLVVARMRERRQTRTRWLINIGIATFGVSVSILIAIAGSTADKRLVAVVNGLSDVVDGLSNVVRELEGTRRSEELRTYPESILTESDDIVLVPGRPLNQEIPEGDVARIQLRMGNPGRYRLDVTVPELDGDQVDPDPMAALYRERGDQPIMQVGFDDDGGESVNSRLVFNVTDVQHTSYFLDIWEFYGDAATFTIQFVQLTDTQ